MWILGLIVIVWLCIPSVVFYMPPPEITLVIERSDSWPPWPEEDRYERYERKAEED